jgi:hypothetical protein
MVINSTHKARMKSNSNVHPSLVGISVEPDMVHCVECIWDEFIRTRGPVPFLDDGLARIFARFEGTKSIRYCVLLISQGLDIDTWETLFGVVAKTKVEVDDVLYALIVTTALYGIRTDWPGRNNQTLLWLVAGIGDIDVSVELARRLIISVDVVCSTYGGAIHHAAAVGNMPMIRHLIRDLGADIDCLNNQGETAIMVAAREDQGQTVTVLAKRGVDLLCRSGYGETAESISMRFHPTADHTAKLKARTRCANPFCKNLGLKWCAACLKVRYCSRVCQVTHWKTHKPLCLSK